MDAHFSILLPHLCACTRLRTLRLVCVEFAEGQLQELVMQLPKLVDLTICDSTFHDLGELASAHRLHRLELLHCTELRIRDLLKLKGVESLRCDRRTERLELL